MIACKHLLCPILQRAASAHVDLIVMGAQAGAASS
jgi:hypothetical protein